MSNGYPLDRLIGIRERRYEQMTAQRRHQQQVLQQTLKELENTRQELSAFLAFREKEIERRYSEIMDCVRTQEEIADFNSGLSQLYEKEVQFRTELRGLEKKAEEERLALKRAEEQVVRAHKAVEKLESHKVIWLSGQKRLMEYRADLEMEDFRVKKPEY